MKFFQAILAAASVVSTVFAQNPPIAFTSVPAVVVAGQTYNITWSGGDNTLVTLSLRQSGLTGFTTVATLATNVATSYYSWTVSPNLPTASNYDLLIVQGLSGINYSGMFSLVGGSGTSSIPYSGLVSSTTSSNSTMSMTGTAASMGTETSIPRNTTFSAQTLTSSRSTSATVTSTSTAVIASNTASATGNSAAGTTGSSAALVMGLLGAVMFLQ